MTRVGDTPHERKEVMFQLYMLALGLTAAATAMAIAYGKVHRHQLAPRWPR